MYIYMHMSINIYIYVYICIHLGSSSGGHQCDPTRMQPREWIVSGVDSSVE